MSHKFKIGDKVKVTLYNGSKLDGIIVFESLSGIEEEKSDIFSVRIGNVFVHVYDDELEKIEECVAEPKYNVGDIVSFKLDNTYTGIIKRTTALAGHLKYLVELNDNIGVSFDIMENQILNKIEESQVKPAYKVGDRVYFYRADNGQTTTGVINQIRPGKYADMYEYFIRLDNDEDDKPINLQWIEQINVHCLYEERHFIPTKYKIGDRVIFYFTPDHVKIGVIEEIDD